MMKEPGGVEAAGDVLHVEPELLDLVEPPREEAIDVLLGAQPRDGLVVSPEVEIRATARGAGSATVTAEQVVTEDPQGMYYRQQLQDMSRVRLLRGGQPAAFVGDRVVAALVVRLGEHGGDGDLTSVSGQSRAATRVEDPQDRSTVTGARP